MRAIRSLWLGGPVAYAFVACSSFSSNVEPGASKDAATAAEGDGSGAIHAPPDSSGGPEAGAPACEAGAARSCGDRYFFTSAGTLRGDFAGDGGSATAIADAFCKTEAERQSVSPDLHGRNWRAWVCTLSETANGRAATTSARWITPDNVVVFPDLDALRSANPIAPLSHAPRVWTGCDYQGFNTGVSCTGWTSIDGGGEYGIASQAEWSRYATQECVNESPIYCFEFEP